MQINMPQLKAKLNITVICKASLINNSSRHHPQQQMHNAWIQFKNSKWKAALPVFCWRKTQTKLFCCTIIPSLHISGQQSPDLATALLCQGCHTPVAHHRQVLPPQDHCWNVLLKDQPYHFLSLLPCKEAPTRLTFPQQTESRQKSPQKTTLLEEDRRPGSYHFALSS